MEGIPIEEICNAVKRLEDGLLDADLGGGVIRQRTPRLNEGKSEGHRSIILYSKNDCAFLVHGYAENEKSALSRDEPKALKALANVLLAFGEKELEGAVNNQVLTEVKCNEQDL